ncbi:hypothetical protein C2E23DRAFT_864029 [Lenzites betulinus]|nr:hypothetical protein C2E23DRAFT_864029 [Lenzites betulinus]
MSSFNTSTAYVYTFDAATGALAAELMRVPGGQYAARAPSMGFTHNRVLPTLGKDTEGLIEEVLIRRGEVVYFVERKADGDVGSDGSECANENGGAATRGESGRSRAVRRAMREVREVELMARRLEAAMMEDDGDSEGGVDAGMWAAGEVDSEDEDDEDVEDSDDEDESLWGGYDDESDVEESGSDGDVEENDEDDEVVFGLVGMRVDESCVVKGNWEVALFGKDEDEADRMDVDGIQGVRAETTAASTPWSFEDSGRPVEEWTRPEDWDRPICTMPSADFGLMGFRPEPVGTYEDAGADLGPGADRGRGWTDEDVGADLGHSADLGWTDVPRTGTRAEAVDVASRRTRTDVRSIVPTPRRTTEPAPRVNLVQVSVAAKANLTGPTPEDAPRTRTTDVDASRGRKRKTDDEDVDTDASKVPEVQDALARTRTLAGLKFKKMKTCHAMLTTGKKRVMSVVASAVAVVTGSTTAARSGRTIQRRFDGEQELPSRQDDLAGRKRKTDDKEDGELSDSGVPVAKRPRVMQAPRTSGHGTGERGAQRRWLDGRRTATTAQRRSHWQMLVMVGLSPKAFQTFGHGPAWKNTGLEILAAASIANLTLHPGGSSARDGEGVHTSFQADFRWIQDSGFKIFEGFLWLRQIIIVISPASLLSTLRGSTRPDKDGNHPWQCWTIFSLMT